MICFLNWIMNIVSQLDEEFQTYHGALFPNNLILAYDDKKTNPE